MRATMLLADAAQVADGKLYILGAGWSVCGPGPAPMALAVKLEVPPSEARRKHTWSIVLLNDDGEPVLLFGPDGQKSTVAIHGEIERVRGSESVPEDETAHLAFAVNMVALPLEPGTQYVWQLSIDNKSRKDWQVAFRTRPAITEG
jgi:Family of unknown function (DUF6941)